VNRPAIPEDYMTLLSMTGLPRFRQKNPAEAGLSDGGDPNDAKLELRRGISHRLGRAPNARSVRQSGTTFDQAEATSDLDFAQEHLDLGQHGANPRDFRKDRGHNDLQRSFPSDLLGQHWHEAICGSV